MLKKFPIAVLALLIAGAAIAQQATGVRIEKKNADDPRGDVVVTVDGADKTIAYDAYNAWLIGGGNAVAVAGADGAGGYENEGQSLWKFGISSNKKVKLVSEVFVITKVVEVPTKNGRTALLLSMTDGGLGASHIAVAHPTRGEVLRMVNAGFVGVKNGRAAVAAYPKNAAIADNPKPVKMIYLDLDQALRRQASTLQPVGKFKKK